MCGDDSGGDRNPTTSLSQDSLRSGTTGAGGGRGGEGAPCHARLSSLDLFVTFNVAFDLFAASAWVVSWKHSNAFRKNITQHVAYRL